MINNLRRIIMDMENITLLDIIDRQTLQSLQDAFAEATGMAIAQN